MREFDLIEKLVAFNGELPESVTIPPGDDMAGLRFGEHELLIAVDQVIDQVHFELASTPLELIGRKAVTRNLSDVAAMAGKPVAALCAALFPRSLPESDAERILQAVRSTAMAYACPVVGGDIAMHDGPLTLSVTVLAQADGIEPVLRRGAEVGDLIYVTGELGGSRHAYDGRVHHLEFEPRLGVARQLAGNAATRPTSMIDLSDGLARDLPHLVKGAEINARALPVTAVARQYTPRDGKPGWLHAVADGEDYELLFTAKHDAPIPDEIDGVRITRIGRVVETPGITLVNGAECTPLEGLGWEHHG